MPAFVLRRLRFVYEFVLVVVVVKFAKSQVNERLLKAQVFYEPKHLVVVFIVAVLGAALA